MSEPGSSPKTVAILGAGYAGLCALRHFSQDNGYKAVIFEREDDIGGIWRVPGSREDWFTHAENDTTRPYSPMYENLQSNSPKDMTAFEGFPFRSKGRSYFKPAEFMEYLRDYAEAYQLMPHIKFRHEVTRVEPVNLDRLSGPQWRIEWRDCITEKIGETLFDVFVVCNGHHDKSFVPEIPGLDNFQGPIIHSSQYKTAKIYRDKSVLIVGASYSANDLACHIQPLAKQMILSRRKPETLFAPFPNVIETGPVKGYGSDLITLSDDRKIHIDAIILCTGYEYYFPFLADNCLIKIVNNRVTPLYRHVIHIEYPTMAFIGLLDYVAYTPTCDFQVKFFKAALDGKMELPLKEDMRKDSDEDHEKQLEMGPRHAHKIYQRIWDYMDKLASDAKFPTYEPVIKKIFDVWCDSLHEKPYDFRNNRLEKIDSENLIFEPDPAPA